MSLKHGPKPRSLTPHESINSLEIWKNNVLYGLRLNVDFRPYLVDGFVWGKKSTRRPTRSLTDTVDNIAEYEHPLTKVKVEAHDEITKAKEDKALEVDLMLDQIANFAECIPRNDIVRDSASLEEVWQKIKLFYNLQSSGSLLNECWNIRRLPDETPQALFARLKQTYDENLITKEGLIHTEGPLDDDEEMSPTLHCTVILQWLEILHPKLRGLVTQRFSTELRKHTYAALFPEISRSIDSLLLEVEEDGQAECRAVSGFQRRGGSSYYKDKPFRSDRKSSYTGAYQKKCCDYCKVLNRRAYQTHNIEDCLFIKRESANKTRMVVKDDSPSEEDDLSEQYREFYEESEAQHNTKRITDHVLNKVVVDSSPILLVHHHDDEVQVTLDSGATCNVIGKAEAVKRKCKIRNTKQTARMADGKSSLEIVGETEVTFHRGRKPFHMTALVASNTDIDILGGIPFMRDNDIAIRPATSEIIIEGNEFIRYHPEQKLHSRVRRLDKLSLKAPQKKVIFPGEALSLQLPPTYQKYESVAVEPRLDSSHNRVYTKESTIWPQPKVMLTQSDSLSLVNDTKVPITVKKHEQICLIHDPATTCEADQLPPDRTPVVRTCKDDAKLEYYSNAVKLNPDKVLSDAESSLFKELLIEYDEVFNPKLSQYNGHSGPCFVEVNMGDTPPPQNNGRTPFYGSSNMQELQNQMDELTAKGVFGRPQELGVSVENISPSFLVRKPSNPQKKRLVTDFGSIAPYCRPAKSLMPRCETVLRKVSGWGFILGADMSEAYYQLFLRKSSMRYCGVVTPFKGLLVYRVGCMGLPGVEVALEELTCLILGDLVQQGCLAKVADDIFMGADTVAELLRIFKCVLHRFLENNINLSAKKTVICPYEVIILGWLWCAGKLRAPPHRLAALAECTPPATVAAMRSFIGAYRFISRVLKGYATILAPLEKTVCGAKSGKDQIQWTDELSQAFQHAQDALKDCKTLTVPVPEDTLWIITDASVQPGAVGATLYTVRKGEPKLAEFFNVKLPEFQQRWMPCELEGLAIGTALHHWSAYIIQSNEKPHVLTDSKPCVESVQKMKKGQFSTSARLSTFLSAVSRYQAVVGHISGAANLPSDFSSRHPVECQSKSCQICTFVKEYAESVVMGVNSLSVADVISGRVQLPYKNRKAWLEVQQQCPDLRKVFTFKKSGTEPSRTSKNLREVKRYMNANLIIAKDGLLVQRKADPLSPMTDHIVIPRSVVHGLLSALHLKLEHPTAYQLTRVFERDFFALSVPAAIATVTKQCHVCQSIIDVPTALVEQSTSEPPTRVGVNLSADVFVRSKQQILVLRETTTSYTLAELIPNETAMVIANALLRMCCILRPSALQKLVIKVDPAPAHRSLFLDKENILAAKNIQLELGREVNPNKNPVADKAIRELTRELLILTPESKEITATTLALAVANTNARVRAPGVSACELWTQRDSVSGEQLLIDDNVLIADQHRRRLKNHQSSEKSKAHGKPSNPVPNITTGSLVYLYRDRDKEAPRPRYLVISIDKKWCKLRRFTRNYFGGRTYDARLDECYEVPLHTDTVNPQVHTNTDESDSSTDQEDSSSMYDPEVQSSDEETHHEEEVEVRTPESPTNQRVERASTPPPEVLVNPQPVYDNTPGSPSVPRHHVNPKHTHASKKSKQSNTCSNDKQSSSGYVTRSKRTVKVPDKFKDFVMGDEA